MFTSAKRDIIVSVTTCGKRGNMSRMTLSDRVVNDKEFMAKDILFMVDTSGSVRDEEISNVYTEICSACGQFHGSLRGKLGFFDAAVSPPVPFESGEDVLSIIPYGGGGIDFTDVFDYITVYYQEVYPSCIIAMT